MHGAHNVKLIHTHIYIYIYVYAIYYILYTLYICVVYIVYSIQINFILYICALVGVNNKYKVTCFSKAGKAQTYTKLDLLCSSLDNKEPTQLYTLNVTRQWHKNCVLIITKVLAVVKRYSCCRLRHERM